MSLIITEELVYEDKRFSGGIMITPRPGPDTDNLKPGAAMRPFYGVDVALMNPDTKVREFVAN